MPLHLIPECISKWRLEELDQQITQFNNYFADAVTNANIKFAYTYTNIVLSILGKSLTTLREISFLASAGYPDGALSLSRNLYEQFIIIAFFEGEKSNARFAEYVEQFYLDYDIRNYKSHLDARRRSKSKGEIPEFERKLAQAKSKAGKEVRGDYWWADKSTFSQLAEYVVRKLKLSDDKMARYVMMMHVAYKRACVTLHASMLGNTLRLGRDADPSKIDTSQTNDGQGFPLWFAISCLILIVGVACSTLGVEAEPYLGKMNELALFYQESISE